MTKLALLGVMALVASVAQAQFLTPFTQADQVSAGWYHTCGVDTGKRLTCWGANGDGQLGDGTTIDRPHPVVPVGMPMAGAKTKLTTFSYDTLMVLQAAPEPLQGSRQTWPLHAVAPPVHVSGKHMPSADAVVPPSASVTV